MFSGVPLVEYFLQQVMNLNMKHYPLPAGPLLRLVPTQKSWPKALISSSEYSLLASFRWESVFGRPGGAERGPRNNNGWLGWWNEQYICSWESHNPAVVRRGWGGIRQLFFDVCSTCMIHVISPQKSGERFLKNIITHWHETILVHKIPKFTPFIDFLCVSSQLPFCQANYPAQTPPASHTFNVVQCRIDPIAFPPI